MKHYIAFILGCLLAFSSCQKSQVSYERASQSGLMNLIAVDSDSYDYEETYSEDIELLEDTPSPPSINPSSTSISNKKLAKKLLKTAYLLCEVTDYQKAKQNVLQSVKKWNGYISDEEQHNARQRISNKITIRVVKENFDTLLNELGKHAFRIDHRNIHAQDVSEKFFDIESRLRTKKAMEQRYLEILQKADKVEDILKVERELRLLREEIETKEGKLSFLSDQVNYSTIHLNIYQSLQIAEQAYRRPSFFGKIVPAIKSGWYVLLDFIIGVLYVWPFLILGILTTYLLRRFLMRKRKK